jgi:hypothetical protein
MFGSDIIEILEPRELEGKEEKGNSQLPCAVSELGTSLANMEMKNLCKKNAISFCLIPYCAVPRVRYPSFSSPISSTTRPPIAEHFSARLP